MLESLGSNFRNFINYLSGKSTINDKNIAEAIEIIKNSLVDADVNLRVIRRFLNSIIEESKGVKVLRGIDPKSQFIKIVNDNLVKFLGGKNYELSLHPANKQSYILMLGLQGSGKTTTCAKLSLKLKKENRKVLLVAADTFRAAAVEQLKILGGQVGVPVFSIEGEKDPIKIVKASMKFAESNFFDSVIVDTRGRLEIESLLVEEIKKIKGILRPAETILVVDSMMGQVAVNIAKEFNENVGLTGAIFSKFDSDTRGGAVLSFKSICAVPIKFIGVGEKIEDLDSFYPERIASRILGMGDVVSLVEKVQSVVDKEEAIKLEEKINKASFNFEDYLSQFRRIRQVGGFSNFVSFLPGVSKSMMNSNNLNEESFNKEEAIILSMTKKERINPVILNNPSRKKRIAMGSGTTVFDVNKLIKKFSQTTLIMKKMKNKDFQNKIASLLGK
ncbi:signal recognition particle protein [Borreliella burgdorferi]|uniref:signal-recognition-particle GTPase n=1 Tax=Borreliella burgdorferi (strain ZS7) TaxID=445985 RepID=A0A0H3C3G9_BORBZ|nr:signal recognition particle protein [Borreliella burgdorferi]ACK74757.1 signal recognition particle protein [Borreliella burgdorferi ZS7]EEH31940.1 signal recognition particle protein [Borreliella burgdorferi Bol26]MCD2331392.1 signal recognition particle protein [Borreliella burgdorferi]MCD2408245.1 signal recognition particle protein [Borreliella burgdorferi]MCR8909123.1 signal recognition particle protein [Borreliella burgdorferi 297]